MQTTQVDSIQAASDDLVKFLGQYVDKRQFTLWFNPTDRPIRLELHNETPKHGKPIADRVAEAVQKFGLTPEQAKIRYEEERTGKKIFLVPANGSSYIPSEYDRAVQDVKDGVIIGGLGTLLINQGAEQKPVLHPSLDAVDAARKRLVEEAKAARDKIDLMEDQLTVARHKYDQTGDSDTIVKAQQRKIEELEKMLAQATAPTPSPGPAQAQAPAVTKKDK